MGVQEMRRACTVSKEWGLWAEDAAPLEAGKGRGWVSRGPQKEPALPVPGFALVGLVTPECTEE